MARKKIALVGAGAVGAMVAHLIALRELGDAVLIDLAKGLPEGTALDIGHGSPLEGHDVGMSGTTDYSAMAGADVVICTAGITYKPGMPRETMLMNAKIVAQVAEQIRQQAPNAFVICVTNPLDAMTSLIQKITGFPHNKVVGMAGVLDSARFRYFLAQEFQVSVEDVSALVVGGHNDAMVPLVRYSNVAGIPLPEIIKKGWIGQGKLEQIMQRVRVSGAEIGKLSGSAHYAPPIAVVQMVESYLKDKKRVLPCSAWVDGQYGVRDMYVGVPVVIGAGGVERVIEIDLDHSEQQAFAASVAVVQESIEKSNEILAR